jgi:hypothetical protein
MAKNPEQDRLNLRLTPELTKRLNKYLVKVTNKKGKLPGGIKSAIAYKALGEWLDKNENDVNAWEK